MTKLALSTVVLLAVIALCAAHDHGSHSSKGNRPHRPPGDGPRPPHHGGGGRPWGDKPQDDDDSDGSYGDKPWGWGDRHESWDDWEDKDDEEWNNKEGEKGSMHDRKCTLKDFDCDKEADEFYDDLVEKEDLDPDTQRKLEMFKHYREHCCLDKRSGCNILLIGGLLSAFVLLVASTSVGCCIYRRMTKKTQHAHRTPTKLESVMVTKPHLSLVSNPPPYIMADEQKKVPPQDAISASAPYDNTSAYDTLKPELILTAPPPYSEIKPSESNY